MYVLDLRMMNLLHGLPRLIEVKLPAYNGYRPPGAAKPSRWRRSPATIFSGGRDGHFGILLILLILLSVNQ